MKKIFGFITCAIILLPLFNQSFVNSKINDAPAWSPGDSWTFDGEFSYNVDEFPLFLNISGKFKELQFKVVGEDEDTYYLDFNGSIELKAIAKIENASIEISASLKNGNASGYAHFKKSNLGLKEFYINVTGALIISGIPIPLSFSGSIKITFTPSYALISFPISNGSAWYTMPSIMKIELGEDLIAFINSMAELLKSILPDDMDEMIDGMINLIDEMFPLELPIGLQSLECLSHSYLTVKAGTYESYYIIFAGGLSFPSYTGKTYFSPTAKNIIKINFTDEAYLTFSAELASSTYHQPGTPEKPQKPVGKERIRKSYEYETFSIDPEGEQLQYGWDWDGDYLVDEWTNFYPSGEKISVSHRWDERGNYDIRVRARDEKGLESEWSDSLAISVPYIKNLRQFNHLIFLLRDVLYLH